MLVREIDSAREREKEREREREREGYQKDGMTLCGVVCSAVL